MRALIPTPAAQDDPELIAKIEAAKEAVKSHDAEEKQGPASRPGTKEGKSGGVEAPGNSKEKGRRNKAARKDGAAEEKDSGPRGHTERYNIPLRLSGFTVGQDSMEWVREYRIRVSQQGTRWGGGGGVTFMVRPFPAPPRPRLVSEAH